MLYLAFSIIMNCCCLAFTTSCTSKKPVLQLDVTAHIQFFFDDLVLRTNHRTISIYYMDDMTMYKFGYYFDSTRNDILVKDEYRRYFFVHKKGDRSGYKFDPNDPAKNGNFQVDSMTKNYAFGGFTWEQLTAITPIVSFDSTTNILKEIYTNEEMAGDTIKFYFSNRFQQYDYSLSKKLDSLKRMKLFRIDVHNGPVYEESSKKSLPPRNSYFLLEEGKDKDLSQVTHYFAEYERMKQEESKSHRPLMLPCGHK